VATPLKNMTPVPLTISSPVVQSEKGSLQPASAFPTNSLENNILPTKNDSAQTNSTALGSANTLAL
jgi:hypothetical protein